MRKLALVIPATALCWNYAFAADVAAAAPRDAQPAACEQTAEDFVPLTLSERLVHGLDSMFGVQAFVFTAVRAGVNQGLSRPAEWGSGDEAYARRFGSAYTERLISQTLQQSAALVLHEDNRYFRSGEHGFGRRLEYAAASGFLARHDDGSRHLSLSSIGGIAGEAFIARAWQPRSTRSAGDAAVSFGLALATRTGLNTAREFLPRAIGRLLR